MYEKQFPKKSVSGLPFGPGVPLESRPLRLSALRPETGSLPLAGRRSGLTAAPPQPGTVVPGEPAEKNTGPRVRAGREKPAGKERKKKRERAGEKDQRKRKRRKPLFGAPPFS